MKSEILVIAEAILANTQVLKMLIEKLPAATVEKVAEKVAEANATPAPAPVATPEPIPTATIAPAPAPVVETVAAPAPITVTVEPVATSKPVPFTSQKELVMYVMNAYKALGSDGKRIEEVLKSVGISNINEVKPEHYRGLFDGIEALKNGAR